MSKIIQRPFMPPSHSTQHGKPRDDDADGVKHGKDTFPPKAPSDCKSKGTRPSDTDADSVKNEKDVFPDRTEGPGDRVDTNALSGGRSIETSASYDLGHGYDSLERSGNGESSPFSVPTLSTHPKSSKSYQTKALQKPKESLSELLSQMKSLREDAPLQEAPPESEEPKKLIY